MKVLVLSHMYPSTFNEVYGIFVHEQVRALMSSGVEICVVSPMPWIPFPINRVSSKWWKMSKVTDQAAWEGVQVCYPRYLVFPRAWFFASSGKQMYHGIKRLITSIYRDFPFDLIHAHVALPDGYAGAMIAREIGVSLVVTIHGQDLQYTIHRNSKCRNALKFVFDKTSQVIVVSHKLRRLAEKYFGCYNKLTVIPNGINLQKVAMSRSGNLPEDRNPTFLSVSNLICTKGIDLTLSAVACLRKKYPMLRYKVIGEGPLESKLRRQALSLGLSDCVEFLGRQPHIRVMEHMAKCDIFVLPSWNEGFGVVYLEAMAHGKPVIGCQDEGIEDFVEHGKTGLLVKPKDVDSLVEAIDFLLSYPEEARAMGERARKVVLENYTWEKAAEKKVQVYKEVLNAY